MRRRLLALFAVMVVVGCPPTTIDSDIVRPLPGEPFLEELPGPLTRPFKSFPDALIAACNKIITKPNAVTPRPGSQEFSTYWRRASEYCAWIYYTPDGNYELSKLTDQSRIDPANRKKTCLLPPAVRDRRYSLGGIKYICALHNHLFDDALSTLDLKFIVQEGLRHGSPPHFGYRQETRDGGRLLSTVAFFSNQVEAPTCDGYYQYFPLTGVIVKVTHKNNRSTCEQFALVKWDDTLEFPTVTEVKGPCPNDEGAP